MIKSSHYHSRGAVAQLGERIVRNDEVAGSIPASSTKYSRFFGFAQDTFGGLSISARDFGTRLRRRVFTSISAADSRSS
jgi:hypothetical protein